MEAASAHSTKENGTEYWVARVVRQMQGCTPSKIDSVIQANLPRREIRWSLRPDTLGIPGLEGRLAYDAGISGMEYDPGFFKGNALLKPGLSIHGQKVTPEALAQAHPYHDVLLATTILCLVLLAAMINPMRKFLQTRAKDFFYTNNERSRDEDKAPLPGGAALATYMLICCTGSLYAMYYANEAYNLFLCAIPPYGLLAVYAGCFAAMFLAKRLLSAFINWIFFDKNSRRIWRLDYNFLLFAETSALMSVVTAGICYSMPANAVLWAGLCVVTVVKLLLLYKTYAIFLPHLYGFLHLLSYLCALEILPCLALWVILHSVTGYLTTTF